jgi:hypothetical protein
MSTSEDRPGPDGQPVPPAWDAPPPTPSRDRPAEQAQGWSPAPPAQGWGPPPGYGPSAGHGPAGWAGGPQQTEAKAIVALVLAIGSFVVLPFLPAVAALFVGSAARRDIAASGGRLTGGSLVTAAKVISWVNIGLCIAGVVLMVLAFGLFFSIGTS